MLSAAQLVVGLFAVGRVGGRCAHSLSDMVSDGVVLLVNRHSHSPADTEHPYGHHRFETAASPPFGALLGHWAVHVMGQLTRLQNRS